MRQAKTTDRGEGLGAESPSGGLLGRDIATIAMAYRRRQTITDLLVRRTCQRFPLDAEPPPLPRQDLLEREDIEERVELDKYLDSQRRIEEAKLKPR